MDIGLLNIPYWVSEHPGVLYAQEHDGEQNNMCELTASVLKA